MDGSHSQNVIYSKAQVHCKSHFVLLKTAHYCSDFASQVKNVTLKIIMHHFLF